MGMEGHESIQEDNRQKNLREALMLPEGYDVRDVSNERYREYDMPANGVYGLNIYRIDSPGFLITRPGGRNHIVVDGDDVVHCVPAPGVDGTVLRWRPRNDNHPVIF